MADIGSVHAPRGPEGGVELQVRRAHCVGSHRVQHVDRRRRHVKLRAIIAADKMGVQERHDARVVPHLGKPGLTLMTVVSVMAH